MHAYSELYVNDAKERLAHCFDYLINDGGHAPAWVATMFTLSGCAEQIERGNPAYLAGMSGVEMARKILHRVYHDNSSIYGAWDFPEATPTSDGYSSAYWAGWVLAEYQWVSGHRFKDIFNRVPLEEIIAMYPVFHEMDITQFIDSMEKRYRSVKAERKLKHIRKCRDLTQAELAQQSGVPVRNIQAYEQGSKDIDKAKACTLYRLSRVLGCNIEDLLENPIGVNVDDAGMR